jgi:hypothetical protein
LSHYEITFRNANNLASHKVGSYNPLHWLSQFGNLRMSPPPSSFGGLNPNRSFGFFFAFFALHERLDCRGESLSRGGVVS